MVTIRECSSIVSIRDGNGNFEFTIVMYHPDNDQRSSKPQSQHAERMILPGSSKKILAKIPLSMPKLRNRLPKKSDFVIFFFFFLIQNSSLAQLNPCQSDIWWFTTARKNSYQPVLVILRQAHQEKAIIVGSTNALYNIATNLIL